MATTNKAGDLLKQIIVFVFVHVKHEGQSSVHARAISHTLQSTRWVVDGGGGGRHCRCSATETTTQRVTNTHTHTQHYLGRLYVPGTYTDEPITNAHKTLYISLKCLNVRAPICIWWFLSKRTRSDDFPSGCVCVCVLMFELAVAFWYIWMIGSARGWDVSSANTINIDLCANIDNRYGSSHRDGQMCLIVCVRRKMFVWHFYG